MQRALAIAAQGKGFVEPNPLVGCLIVKENGVVGAGWHERFGGAHAEVNALRQAGAAARDATAFVTLEPCCHHGKTPPCTQALIDAQVRRVVVAMSDPFPKVAGQGIAQLERAGIEVTVGLLSELAQRLNAPFVKLVTQQQPWVIAKWAMTLDGKIATANGDSKWISNEDCRKVVHRLRGQVDGVLVGIATAIADDPLLNARPAGARVATRIVVDSRARLSDTSQLVQTARTIPLLVAVGPESTSSDRQRLSQAGAEVLLLEDSDRDQRLRLLLHELGARRMTNVLVEGGSQIFGALLRQQAIDEAHVFVGNQLAGGDAYTAFGGKGYATISSAARIAQPAIQIVGDNVYVSGHVSRAGQTK
jgi:diaminohydroxyphosphoribosylaminopyrimidine deaminase/5-amino-6-(5-phosphoribosylamino)uracil reductase